MVEINLFVVNVKNGRHTIRVVCFLFWNAICVAKDNEISRKP